MNFYRVMFLLLVVLAIFGSASGDVSLDNCAMECITVPVMEYDGKVTLAASFMYGQYAQGATDIGSMFNSKKLDERLGSLSDSAKERCPEYVILKRFRLTKEGKPEQAIKYYEPGYSRETALRYLDCEPVNIEIIGASEDKLSKELAFFKSAEMAYWSGEESKALSCWDGSNGSRKTIEQRIKSAKHSGDWPRSSLGFGLPVRKVIALLRCDLGTIVYYKNASSLYTVTINEGSQDNLSLSGTYYLKDGRKNIFGYIKGAIEKIYGE